MFATLALTLLCAGAGAHEPHDPTYWVATSPGEEPGWLVVMLVEEPKQAALLIRTQDRLTMETRYLSDGTTVPQSAAMLGPERLVVGTDMQGLWVSDDVGDSFAVHPDVPADASVRRVVAGPELLDSGLALAAGTVRTDHGVALGTIWRSDDAGEIWREVLSVPEAELVDLSLAPDWSSSGRAVAATAAGGVYLSVDRGLSWELSGELGQPAYQLAAGEGMRVWAGTADDGLLLSEDDGASFAQAAFAGESVSAVTDFGRGLVMAAQPEAAVFVSRDGGASFTLSKLGLDRVESGQPIDGIHHYRLEQGGDGAIYLAAWEGVAWSDDEGEGWQTLEATPPWVQRGVELSYGRGGDLMVVAGSYGGGVEMVTPSTQRAQPLGDGLWGGFIKRLAVSDDFGRDASAYVNLIRKIQETQDQGVTWPFWADERLGDIADVSTSGDWSERAFVIAAGVADEGGGWCWSLDRGEPACHVPLSGEQVCKAVAVSPGFAADGMAWSSCGSDGQIFVTDDFAETWADLATLDAYIFDISATAGGQELYVGTSRGLFRAWQGGALEPIEPQDQPVWALEVATVADAVHLFVLAPQQGWLLSTDGGESFEDLPRPTHDLAIDLALSPDYADDGTLVVGSFDGTWFSEDRGQSWIATHVIETLDDDNPLWDVSPDWVVENDDEALYHTVRTSSEIGATAAIGFRGVGLELIAPTGADGGLLSVSLDGEPLEDLSLAGEEVEQAVVLALWDLDDGWHSLGLELLEGTAAIDGARVWRQPGWASWGDDTGDTGDTGQAPTGHCSGCSGMCGARGLLLLPWLAGLLALRRRRPGPLSPLPRAAP